MNERQSQARGETMRADTPNAAPGTFEAQYDAWSESVYRYLVHLIGSPEAVEDLFQETWMKALEHRHTLADPGRFGPWILRIARNLAFNLTRQRRRKAHVWVLSDLAFADEPDADAVLDREASDAPGPRDRAIQAERRRIIRQAIGALDLQAQEMIQLRYFERLTLAEVAEVLGVPLGTVCTKVHRSLKAVRQRLRAQGYMELSEI